MNEAQKLRELGCGVGDILEGDEGYGPDRILITAIGTQQFLCIWDYKCKGDFSGRESGNTTLSCRGWKKVGHIAKEFKPRIEPTEGRFLTDDDYEDPEPYGGFNTRT